MLVRADNAESRKLMSDLGCTLEGVARKAASDDVDLLIFGILREEARRWMKGAS